MLLFIDNFDSFTYNLVHALKTLGADVYIVRNNAITVAECIGLAPKQLLIGPGPGTPSGAGISKELIHTFAGKIPILGVCLGHQAINEVFGGTVIRSHLGPVHGKTSRILHTNKGIFRGLPDHFLATRYHSLVVNRKTFPENLEITAETNEGEVMGLKHRTLPIEGVQFHPESVLSEFGNQLFTNFLEIS